MRLRLRPAGTLAAAAAIAVLVGGCNSDDDWSRPHAKPSPVGALGPGFIDSTAPPAPEATVTPSRGSWDAVHPSKGYRVVLLTTGDDAQTKTLVTAVQEWAKQEHVSLKTVTATAPDQFISRISEAIDLSPDLIISAGNDLVDPLAMVTPNHLDQQFLVVGAPSWPSPRRTSPRQTGPAPRSAAKVSACHRPTIPTRSRPSAPQPPSGPASRVC